MVTSTQTRTEPDTGESTRSHGGRPRILRRKLRRDIFRQKWQFAAVTVTIVLGVMLFAASYDSFLNLTASYEHTYDRLAFADLTVSGGDQGAFIDSARNTDGVAAVTDRIQADVPFRVGTDVETDGKLIGRIVGMQPDEQPDVDKVDVLEGTYLDPSKPNGVLVETHMAEHFDLKPGDEFSVALADGFTEVEMLGEVASAEYIFPARSRQDLFTTPEDFGVLFVPDALAARASPATQIPQALVLYDDDADKSALDTELTRDAESVGATEVTTQEDQASNAALSEDLQGFNELSFMFPILFLTAAGLATFIILNRIVHSQRGQIGTLAANGIGRRTILHHYLSYGLVIGSVGAIIGLAIGIPLGGLITRSYTDALSIPDTVTAFYVITPVVGIIFGIVMGALAAWAPARAAVRIEPAEAIRGEAPPPKGNTSLIERILPPVRRLPTRRLTSLRGIGRSKRRSLSTVLGVALAIILILASWGMVDTMQLLLDEQFDEIQHNDAQVFLNEAVDAQTLDAIAGVDGVADAEAVITLDATLRADSHQYASELQTFDADTKMHTFEKDGGGTIDLPDKGVLVGVAVKDLLDVDRGDKITLAFSGLGTQIEEEIVAFVAEPIGTFAYMQTDALAEALATAAPPLPAATLASPEVASAMVVYDDGADADAVRTRLTQEPFVSAVVTSTAIRDLLNQFLSLFYAFVGIMLIFGGIMAFALIFNTISVNISERAGELTTMRANGVSAKQINRLMTGENMILTAIGIPIGLFLGYWVAAGFMSSFSSDLFNFSIQMRWTTFLFTALAIVIVTLISQWPGLRAVRRLDIATVVRERSQ